jgi:hypothetical protein
MIQAMAFSTVESSGSLLRQTGYNLNGGSECNMAFKPSQGYNETTSISLNAFRD